MTLKETLENPTPMSDYQKFIHTRTYARFDPETSRRETWIETVNRYARFILDKTEAHKLPMEHYESLVRALVGIKTMDVMPSMRLMHSAGPAAELENLCGYNCGYLPIDTPEAFSELMYVLMCGTGCGFSVEYQYSYQLPSVGGKRHVSPIVVPVEDSREGWALAFRQALQLQWTGHPVTLDVSKVRPKGSPLKTFGGRASGPEALVELVKFTGDTLLRASRRPTMELRPIEAYDIACKVAQCVISGGTRRSATICLFSPQDTLMLHSKTPEEIQKNPWRCYSNNSVATHDPEASLLRSVLDLSKETGEPGIFNRGAALAKAQELGREAYVFGCNPCGEIILRPRQLCNLTEVVCRPSDTVETLRDKVIWATILGTIQSSFTQFNTKVLHPDWKTNSDAERLLGVSLTGICDCPELLTSRSLLSELRHTAKTTNRLWSHLLEIPESKGITCVKPSGTVSQLVNSSSGCHPRFAQYYLRSVQVAHTDPLATMMIDQGVPHVIDMGSRDPVFQFPIAAPKGSLLVSETSVRRAFLNNKTLMDSWCDHNVSQTITLYPHQWEEALGFLVKNFGETIGITMFPQLDPAIHKHLQWTPYREICKAEYDARAAVFPKIDFSKLQNYETKDTSEAAHEYACVGGSCSL